MNAEKKIVNSDFNLKLGKIQCEGKINKQTKKNLQKSKFRRTNQKPEFKTSQNIIKMKYVALPTGNKPKHSKEKKSLTEKCQHVGHIRLNVNAEKKNVNSDFNLKLGKIQCEGKINKQTQKNTEIEIRRTDRKPEFVEFKNSEFVEKSEI